MYQRKPEIGKGVDWLMIWLYAMLVMIGLLCIFSVEYRSTDGVVQSFLGFKKNTANNYFISLRQLHLPHLFCLQTVNYLLQWPTFLTWPALC